MMFDLGELVRQTDRDTNIVDYYIYENKGSMEQMIGGKKWSLDTVTLCMLAHDPKIPIY
jgi:hypothetical protein